jgi:hypothetical protein
MSNRYGKSGARTGYAKSSQTSNDDFIQVRITPDAYHMLTTYMFLKYGRIKGRMPYIVSDLIIKAVISEMPEIVELRKKYGSNIKTQGHVESKSVQPQNEAITPIQENVEVPQQVSSMVKSEKTLYDRWLVKYAGVIRGIKNMKAMEKEAKEAKFLFYPVGKDSAVVIDRYWVNKAIELGNHPQLKVSLGDAEEIARQVVEGGKRDDELTLRERVALALYTLNRDGSAIYASNGWTLTIPDLALEEKPKGKGAGEKKTEQKQEAPSKVEEKPAVKGEDACKDRAVPETGDIEFVRVDGVVGQIAYRECVEKRGYHLYMAAPEVGVVVNPQYESALLDKVKKGEVQYSREEVLKALESYLKNRAKALTGEDKERILLRLLLQEVKVTYADGKWRVVEKPATGTMLDKLAGQGV